MMIYLVTFVFLLGQAPWNVNGQKNQCVPAVIGGDGLFAEYYADPDLSGPVEKSQVDPTINLDWVKTPIVKGETNERCCSARWSGTIMPNLDGTYTFRVSADGGFRLWIDKKLILDAWAVREKNWPRIEEVKVLMLAGKPVSILLTYTTGYRSSINQTQNMYPKGPFIRLQWLQPGRGWAYVPSRVLAPEEPGALPSPRQSAGGLLGAYFTNKRLVGPDISRTRIDRMIDFSWNKNAPMRSLSQTEFSARWTGKLRPPMTGKYTFYLTADNGVRLYVDDILIIDAWGGIPGDFSGATPDTLVAGVDYPIVIEYCQSGGNAYLRFYWELAGCIRKELVPESVLIPEPAGSAVSSDLPSTFSVLTKYGLRAQFYPNVDLAGDATIVYVDHVDFDWKGQQPWSQYPQIPAKEFSARFSGSVQGGVDGLHTFWITSDDGHRLWVDNQLLSDTWNIIGEQTRETVISLRRGVQYAIKLEYRQRQDLSKLKLEWAWGPRSREVVPTERFTVSTPMGVIIDGDGLSAEYFSNSMLTPGPVAYETTVSVLNFAYMPGQSPFEALPSAKFWTARFTGSIYPLYTEEYTIFVSSRDGFRLWVGTSASPVIDDWKPHSLLEFSAKVSLTAKHLTYFKLEWLQWGGSAALKVEWQSATQRREVIPHAVLFSAGVTSLAIPSSSRVLQPLSTRILNGDGLNAEYFPNLMLTPGQVTYKSKVSVLNFAYGPGQSPYQGLPSPSYWTARFTGMIYPLYTEQYTIYVSSNDGTRVWIGNSASPIIADWTNHTLLEMSARVSLTAGQLTYFKLEWLQAGGSAALKVEWQSARQTRQVIPQAVLFSAVVNPSPTPSINGDGLNAEYFPNLMLTPGQVAYKRKVSVLNFAYVPGESPYQGLPDASYWTARFTGMINPLYTEQYTIYVSSNDGTRVWIGTSASPIIDDWTYHSLLEMSARVSLTAGQRTYFRLEWLQAGGSAALKVEWQSARQRREIIPQAVLFSAVVNPSPTTSPRATQPPSPTTSAPTPQPTQQPSSPPNNVGRWDNYTQWPLIATAMVNLPDGKVLGFAAQRADDFYYYQTDSKTFATIYDPRTGSFQNVDHVGHDMYCAALTLLPDGRLFAGGGGNQENSKRVSIFDPFTKTWQRGQDLAFGHWYGTAVVTADSSVFVVLGSETSVMRNVGSTTPELSQGNDFTKPFRQLYGIDMSGKSPNHRFYPFIHMAPNGKLFETGTQDNMYEIDPQAKTITLKGKRVPGPWAEGDSWGACYVMYDEAKVLALSGVSYFGSPQARAFQRVWSIDISGTGNGGNVYVGTKVADMILARAFINAVTLPNGHVLAIGGQGNLHDFDDTDSRLQPEIWDPYGSADGTGKWTLLAPMKKPRNYHSTAVLLQDGSVLAAGGGLCGQRCQVNHQDSERFYPPYLFKADGSWAPRPVIGSAPNTVVPNGIYTLKISGAGFDRITRVSVIHHASVTHSISTDHRQLKVPIIDRSKSASGEYKIQLHSNYNVLTPGYWYLFVLNDAGTPSVAVNVKVNYPI